MKKTFVFMSILLSLIISSLMFTGCEELEGMLKYTVSFDSDGGTAVPSQKILKGHCAEEPEPPTKEGFIFGGWTHRGELFDFATPIETDVKLKAVWEEKLITYTVTFDSAGGSSVTAQKVQKGKNITKPVAPTKEGYTFTGWYLSDSGFYLSDSAFSFSTPISADITLKAKWHAKTEYVPEPLSISIFTIQQRKQPSANNKTYKWIKEKFGVEFTWDILSMDKDQKIGLLIASGDLPDLVEVDSEKFQGAGCLRDLKPLIEKYCPNLMRHYSSAWAKMLDVDGGHIYSLPNYGVIDGTPSDTYFNQNAWWIQKRVLKEFGYPQIKTIDQYFDLLEKYYKDHKITDGLKTIPFSIITADWEAFNLWNAPNFLAGYPNDGNGHVDYIDGKYVYKDNFSTEFAKKWFKLANSYYQKGLIDPESFTDTSKQYYTKIANGQVLGMFIQGWEFMGEPQQTLYTAGKYDQTYVPLPIVFDENTKPHYRDQSLPNLQRGYGITVKCSEEKTIKILKFMDAMLEEDNQKVLYWGFAGEDYLIDTDGSKTGTKGAAYRTDEQRKNQGDSDWLEANRALLWSEEAPKLEGTMPSGYTRGLEDLPWEFEVSQHSSDVEVWEAYNVGSYAELMDPDPPQNAGWYPMWQCNPSEGAAAEAMGKFEGLLKEYLPKMITGKPEEFETTWKTFYNKFLPVAETYNAYMQQQLNHRVSLYGGQ